MHFYPAHEKLCPAKAFFVLSMSYIAGENVHFDYEGHSVRMKPQARTHAGAKVKVQVQLNNEKDDYPESRVIKIGENGDVVVSELSELSSADAHSHSEHSDDDYCHSCDHDNCSEHFEDYDEDYDECVHHQPPMAHEKLYWSSTLPSVEEREQVRQFWTQLDPQKRRDLLNVEYSEVYKVVHENPPGCNCRGCSGPKKAFERDLEKLYHAMHMTANEDLELSSALVHEMLGLEDPKPAPTTIQDIGRVADDILNNNGSSFIDLVEQLDEERGLRPDDDDGDDDEYDYDEEYELESERQRKQLHNAYRYLQVVIARIISGRLVAAYKEKVAEDSTRQLIEELEAEERRKKEKEEKERRKKEKLKEKKRLQQLAKEEERRKREEDKLEQERIHQEEMRRKTEEGRRRKEEERRKREEEQRRREEEQRRRREEKQRKEEEKRREKERQEREAALSAQPPTNGSGAPANISVDGNAASAPVSYSAEQLSQLLSKLNIPVEKPDPEPMPATQPAAQSSLPQNPPHSLFDFPEPQLPSLAVPQLSSLDLFPDPLPQLKQPFPSINSSIWDLPASQKSIWGPSSIWSKPSALSPAQIEAVQIETIKATATLVADNQCYPANLLYACTRQAMLSSYSLDLTMDQFADSLASKVSQKLGVAFDIIYDELATPALVKVSPVATDVSINTWNIGF
ncbi:hypothetical protein KL918_002322 [Ogataea parapolymorpha]|uniref:Stress response protein NST1 n=1 Tax=Ogataea parapolymorpha (strain ATCC 26012 / BCRC 20466 / JCM 22074 / NRRL Y-7560 / DL-1) TaxID=871575 RepID=W1QJM7_OGAPD|nr:hypothetical protein HPODL_02217 [Ogataea parapolymorpha DL-1]ESX02903.1 hypothetical protein HPODL_02217 [Ogataea parapolymorpha DL-1]KAG7867725.1 hypothetical protein KL918_002322 [Ogataea parapolymorpha]KAG7869741.1 hypothetical protein KL916_005086 [Ogataea parapolymorpha]